MINETKRVYGKVREIPVEELARVFGGLECIRFAVLFGSRAGGRLPHGSKSDYDFAVLMDKSLPCDWGHLAKARVDIGQALRLPDGDFDVVDLELAGSALKRSIKSSFLVLKGGEDYVRRLLG